MKTQKTRLNFSKNGVIELNTANLYTIKGGSETSGGGLVIGLIRKLPFIKIP